MYTSGSTGDPKGVMHRFGTFQTHNAQVLQRVPLNQNDRVLSYLRLAHIAERRLVEHTLLATGMQVFFAESQETFVQDMQRARPTFFFSVPEFWNTLHAGVHAELSPHKLQPLLKIPLANRWVQKTILTTLGLDQCRLAACGTSPMPLELLRWYGALGWDLIALYGMTETGYTHSTDVQRPLSSGVGPSLNGVDCRLDPRSAEVQVRSAGLMLGYFLEPELSAQAFTSDGWLRIGDRGSLDAQGNLRLTGKLEDLWRTSKGKYVAAADIEALVAMITGLEACCVVGANLAQPLAILGLSTEFHKKALDPHGRSPLENWNCQRKSILWLGDAHRLTGLPPL